MDFPVIGNDEQLTSRRYCSIRLFKIILNRKRLRLADVLLLNAASLWSLLQWRVIINNIMIYCN